MRGFSGCTRFLKHCARRPRSTRHCSTLLLTLIGALPTICSAQIDHIQAAAHLLSQGQTAPAEAEARKALENPTTRALALAMLGTIRLQEGKYPDSTSFLNQALALNPHLVGARTTLGTAYQLQGKLELARQNFQEAIKVDAGNFNARFGLAKVEASLHNSSPNLPMLSISWH
jgi:Tfp pilus assembly protein PilF